MQILSFWITARTLALASSVFLAAISAVHARAAAGEVVVVELFTSQGCSSCPPADALLAELAQRRGVIALSLHVDYWDYIGWKDPYASPRMTGRQRAYARELGLHYVYTPQMVVDGVANVVGSRREEVLDALTQRAAHDKPVEIRFEHGDGAKVVISAGDAAAGPAEVWLVLFDERHQTNVIRGENAGRMVENVHVVREFRSIGTWKGEALEIALNLDDAAQAGRYGCAVLVQRDGTGPILGAAAMTLEH